MKPQNKDWKKFELREVCVLSKEKVQTSSLVPSCYISTENMLDNLAGIKTAKDLPSVKQVTKYSKNDILLSNIRLYLRKLWYADRDGGCSADVLVLHPQKSIDSLFLFYVLSSENFWLYASSSSKGSKMPRGEKEAIFSFPLLLPPISEQRKIAEILSACERVLTLKKELKAQKIKQKKWLMQKLLNPVSGVRLPGFMGEWETVTLGDLFDFSTSLSASRDKLGTDGIPYLHYGDIHKSSQTFIDVAMDWETLPKLKIGEIQDKYLLKDGDVVFVDASEDYEGASKYVVIYNPENRPFLAGLHTLPAHSKTDRLDRQFKRFCFQSHSVKTQVMFYLSGMKVYGLNRENIGKIKLSFPSLAEQTAIAEVLSAADRELDLLEEEIQAWERKKKALSQLLLRGIVRV